MTDSTPRRWLNRWGSASRRLGKVPGQQRPRSRLYLEALEGRRLPSTVTNLNDSGPGSLRDAINNTPAGGTVDFERGLSGTISLTASLAIASNLTIDGPGPDVITVTGNNTFRVFFISPNPTVSISGLTIAAGNTNGDGGGIYLSGTLTVTDCILVGNSAPNGSGGAIYDGGVRLTVQDSVLTGNHAKNYGGAIYDAGATLIVRGSTIAGNDLMPNVGGGGGGIAEISGTVVVDGCTLSGNNGDSGGAIESNGGTITVNHSTLSRNTARSGGGISSFSGMATVTDSTVSDNQGGGISNGNGTTLVMDSTVSGNRSGAGIGNQDGTVTVSNSTVFGNSNTTVGGGIANTHSTRTTLLTILETTVSGNSASSGGGVYAGAGATLNIKDTIVAGNTASSSPDVIGTLGSEGYNLIGNPSGGSGYVASDLLNVDPRLGTLADNGGPTLTMALLPGSPAIGAGDPTDAPMWDQRGPGYPRVVNGLIDIGAFEVQNANPYLVTNTNDAGPGSLRQTVLNADGSSDPVTITFAIPSSGVHTIRPLSPLPTITTPVVLDGTSQPGYAGQPLIVLDGASAGPSADGLTVAAGDSTVKGLVINDFGGAGLHLEGVGGDLVTGNYLGTDATGTLAHGNGVGLFIDNISANTVGGTTAAARNLISGNRQDGLRIGLGATANLVEGNFIGSDITGSGAVPNGANGLTVSSARNTLGGTAAGAGNLISGNTGDGISLGGIDNQVLGNTIGTNAARTAALGNRDGIVVGGPNNTVGGVGTAARNIIAGNRADGVAVNPGATANLLRGNVIAANGGNGVLLADGAASNVLWGNAIGTTPAGRQAYPNGLNGVVVGGSDNLIGGTAPGTGNVISGNTFDGIDLTGRGAVFNLVQGNLIGTDATGTRVLGNGTEGINLDGGAADNTIGGTTAGAENVLAGNGGDGVGLADLGTMGNLIQGNSIGTDPSGRLALGNGANGVYFENNASGNTVGGTVAGAGNTIAFSTGDGVAVVSSTGDAIQQNSIFSSGNLGIELINGGNNGQAFPTLTAVTSDGSTTTISGTLTSTPDTTFTLEFFANEVCNPSGYGEGQIFLGSAAVTTDDTGGATFTVTLGVGVVAGQFGSATATDPAGNTSAFAACAPVSAPAAAGPTPLALRAVAVPSFEASPPTPLLASADPAGQVQPPADFPFALWSQESIPAPGAGSAEPMRWLRQGEPGENAPGFGLVVPADGTDSLDLWGGPS